MIKLTQTVKKGGCAAKVPAIILREILDGLNFPPKIEGLTIDGSQFDDAAIYKINESVSLVQTLDFFTPIVDSPYIFGQISAANSLSDVYAMGGKPQTAMAILAFPILIFSQDLIAEVLQGASDKIGEAGASFVGGHSIDDDTLKFGLSVTGTVNPDQIWKNSNAQVGDVLILTKALGTGAATAALKRSEVSEVDIQDELNSMAQLNDISKVLGSSEMKAIHAATDITGFGLAGHAMQMAKASGLTFHFYYSEIPRFEKTLQFIERGFLTKAHSTNRVYVSEDSAFDRLTEIEKQLLFDPQTSGGLLLAVKPDHAASILKSLKDGFKAAAIVGKVTSNRLPIEFYN